jgi:hypothetical protein
MPVADEAVRIDGLRQLNRALKDMNTEFSKELKTILNDVADLVAKRAVRRAPARSGKLRRSIKTASSAQKAQVKGGSTAVPYYGFIDYGNRPRGGKGAVGRKDSNPRKFIPTGRILYPAYEESKYEVTVLLAHELDQFIEAKGLQVDG